MSSLPNSNAGRPGGSGGGGGTRSPSESSYPNAAGPGQQPAQNSSLPWVVNYGTPGGSGTTSSNQGGGGEAASAVAATTPMVEMVDRALVEMYLVLILPLQRHYSCRMLTSELKEIWWW